MNRVPVRLPLRALLLGVVVSLLVWVTVGAWAALGAAVLLVGNLLVSPSRRILATSAVMMFVALPLVWLLGSTLPLSPPSPRLQDNVAAHQLGGLALWMLFVASVHDVSFLKGSDDD